jgi:ketosteroid isomerase-like protein
MSTMRSTPRAALCLAGLAALSCAARAAPTQTPAAPAPEPIATATTPVAVEPVAEAPPPKPSLQSLVQAATKGLAEALGARDAQKAASFFADDASATSYGGWEAHGRDEIAKRLQELFAAFGDAKAVVLRAWTKGDMVVEESAWAGTMTGDFMGRTATHAPVGQLRVDVLVFDADGRVKELREYADDAGLLAQMSGKKDAPPVPLIPTNAPSVHVAAESPEDDKLAAWGRALGEGDAGAVAAGLADDSDAWVSFDDKPATRGKKALGKQIAGWTKAFPDAKWTTTASWGIDGFAIVEHTMTGTQKGPLGVLKASNKPVTSWHWLTIVQPDAEAQIHHVWAYANLVELLRQTGALDALATKPRRAAGRDTAKVPPAAPPGH